MLERYQILFDRPKTLNIVVDTYKNIKLGIEFHTQYHILKSVGNNLKNTVVTLIGNNIIKCVDTKNNIKYGQQALKVLKHEQS